VTIPWNDTAFTVAMQHLAPGDKLSEVEFLKRLGTCQWDAIARVLGRPTQEITSEFHERLYASWIDIELKFGTGHAPDRLGEGARIRVRNRVRVFARRFVEGFFVFGEDGVPDALLQATKTRDDLRALDASWCYMTNAFIAPVGGNTRLKVFKPAGIDDLSLPEAERTPAGIEDHARVQATGRIDAAVAAARHLPLHGAPSDLLLRQRRPDRQRGDRRLGEPAAPGPVGGERLRRAHPHAHALRVSHRHAAGLRQGADGELAGAQGRERARRRQGRVTGGRSLPGGVRIALPVRSRPPPAVQPPPPKARRDPSPGYASGSSGAALGSAST
jgi:probable biosynthetic protein (TIGR04098 family)